MLVIYHNPECGTSRSVLQKIDESGADYHIVEYMKAGWTRAQLLGLFAAAAITPKDALRTHKTQAEQMGLLLPTVTDDVVIEAMCAHPILVNRPFVCSPLGVRLCRPVEKVLPLLPELSSGPNYEFEGHAI